MGRGSLRARCRARLGLEELEARNLLSVFTPAQIQQAYGFNQVGFLKGNYDSNAGSGQTIAIVDAYYDPSAQADLAAFSQKYGLPALDGKNGNGTFTQVDLSNKTLSPPGDDWSLETALDIEWAHAIAPKANIVLVEAASDNQDPSTGEPTDLLNAVHYAATKTGASTVSMSWGIDEVPGEAKWDSFFSTPGVTFVAASGDSGAGTIWPAVSPNVVSVGGTTLKLNSSGAIASESGWGSGGWSSFLGGSGGGFSQYESLPTYQKGISTSLTQFGVRLNPDVAYDADPNSGFVVVDQGHTYAVGGTSAGAPQWAALIAIADQARAQAGQPSLSSAQTLGAIYANPGDFHDITQGNTGAYYILNTSGRITGRIAVVAGKGYDLVTGQGSPVANKLIADLAGVGVPHQSTAPTLPPTTGAGNSATGSTGTGNTGSGSTGSQMPRDSSPPPPADAPVANAPSASAPAAVPLAVINQLRANLTPGVITAVVPAAAIGTAAPGAVAAPPIILAVPQGVNFAVYKVGGNEAVLPDPEPVMDEDPGQPAPDTGGAPAPGAQPGPDAGALPEEGSGTSSEAAPVGGSLAGDDDSSAEAPVTTEAVLNPAVAAAFCTLALGYWGLPQDLEKRKRPRLQR
jgi:hypothetical protein